jgi:hypothetical protein
MSTMTHTACRTHESTIRTIDDLCMAMPVGGLPPHPDGQSEIVFNEVFLVRSKTRLH